MMNMADHDAYKDMDDREDNSSDAYGNPGDIDGRATMVPPSGFSTLHVSTNKLKLFNAGYLRSLYVNYKVAKLTTFLFPNYRCLIS